MRQGLLAAAATLALTAPGLAQQAATGATELLGVDTLPADTPLVIVADEMSYDTGGSVARAEGDVEAYYGDRALTAESLTYDEANGTLSASGSVAVRNDDGSYLFADDATLAGDLSEGRISQPRATIVGGGKLAAAEGLRVGDRYNVLSRAVYSPCEVCEENPTPLWQVRARKVVHDQQARDIIYEDAVLDVLGVPVAYLPYFRNPDPSVSRRTGLLAPRLGIDDEIGAFAKLPYYIEISPNRDLTLTPFVTTKDGLIVEAEYRAATQRGVYGIWGALTNNDERGVRGDEWRGAVRGAGRFALGGENYWGFDVDLASDDTFLRRYDFSDIDRTTSRLYVGRETERLFAEANALYFQSFRPDEDGSETPFALPELRARWRVLEDERWGLATLKGSVLHLNRDEGRDVTRSSAGIEWQRQFLLQPGLLVTPFAEASGDVYSVADDPDFDEALDGRANALVGVDVRFPFVRDDPTGTHVIEPIAQVVVSPNQGRIDELPNEDSLDVTFDETTLLTPGSRFPGVDRYESGSRLNVGVRYDYQGDGGLGVEAVYGRVFRTRDNLAFTEGTGLRDSSSDHVGAIRVSYGDALDLDWRFRADDDDLEFRRSEVILRGTWGPVAVAGSYAFIDGDAGAGFDEDREEVAGEAALRVNEYWTLYGGARRDIADDRLVEAELGLRYEDECLILDLGFERRANDDRDAEESSKFGLTVRLKTLGA